MRRIVNIFIGLLVFSVIIAAFMKDDIIKLIITSTNVTSNQDKNSQSIDIYDQIEQLDNDLLNNIQTNSNDRMKQIEDLFKE